MPLETLVLGIGDLNPGWPLGTDPKNEGDNHLRNIKAAVQGSWPNMIGPNVVDAAISANGFNALGNRILNVAAPLAPGDAVNLGHLNTKLLEFWDGWYLSFGVIQFDGSIAWEGSGDWSVTRLSGGVYRILFEKHAPSTGAQFIVCSPAAADPGAFLAWSTVSISQCDVEGENFSGVDADVSFSFMRMAYPINFP